jgi:hypothetical protein
LREGALEGAIELVFGLHCRMHPMRRLSLDVFG